MIMQHNNWKTQYPEKCKPTIPVMTKQNKPKCANLINKWYINEYILC